jgi:hypothetical protein
MMPSNFDASRWFGSANAPPFEYSTMPAEVFADIDLDPTRVGFYAEAATYQFGATDALPEPEHPAIHLVISTAKPGTPDPKTFWLWESHDKDALEAEVVRRVPNRSRSTIFVIAKQPDAPPREPSTTTGEPPHFFIMPDGRPIDAPPEMVKVRRNDVLTAVWSSEFSGNTELNSDLTADDVPEFWEAGWFERLRGASDYDADEGEPT